MAETFQAVHYRDDEGNEPVKDFIDLQPVKHQDNIDWKIDLLNGLSEARPNLPFPHSSQIKGDDYRAFRELRCHSGNRQYRIIFIRSDKLIILLHAFVHDEEDIPEGEKLIALHRWRDFKARMDAVRRRPPRAVGRDAPVRRQAPS